LQCSAYLGLFFAHLDAQKLKGDGDADVLCENKNVHEKVYFSALRCIKIKG